MTWYFFLYVVWYAFVRILGSTSFIFSRLDFSAPFFPLLFPNKVVRSQKFWWETSVLARNGLIRGHRPRKCKNWPCPISEKKVEILSDFRKMVQKVHQKIIFDSCPTNCETIGSKEMSTLVSNRMSNCVKRNVARFHNWQHEYMFKLTFLSTCFLSLLLSKTTPHLKQKVLSIVCGNKMMRAHHISSIGWEAL